MTRDEIITWVGLNLTLEAWPIGKVSLSFLPELPATFAWATIPNNDWVIRGPEFMTVHKEEVWDITVPAPIIPGPAPVQKHHRAPKTEAWGSQVDGGHLSIQPMEYSMANKFDALQHSAIDYIGRHEQKSDLEAAKRCIDMLIDWHYPGE